MAIELCFTVKHPQFRHVARKLEKKKPSIDYSDAQPRKVRLK